MYKVKFIYSYVDSIQQFFMYKINMYTIHKTYTCKLSRSFTRIISYKISIPVNIIFLEFSFNFNNIDYYLTTNKLACDLEEFVA